MVRSWYLRARAVQFIISLSFTTLNSEGSKNPGAFILQGSHKQQRKPQDFLITLAFAFSMFTRLDLGKQMIKSAHTLYYQIVFFLVFFDILKILYTLEITK